jgi:hypothetical protein
MKSSFAFGVLLVCAAIPPTQAAQGAMPRMTTVSPASGKPGDVVTVAGENLDKDNVTAILLTDGSADVPVEIVGQNSTEVKFKIPASAKPGRFALVTRRTSQQEPREIEQPVKVTVTGPGS